VPTIERVTSAEDPRLADYVRLTDTSLRRVPVPAAGLFVAEGTIHVGLRHA
jgi:hypothetical protein